MSFTGMHVNEPHYTFILDKDHKNLLQIKPPKGEVLKIEKPDINNAVVTTDEGVKAVTEHIEKEVANLQKQKEKKENQKIIIISAQNNIITAIKADELKVFEYLPKPFDLDELLNLVSSTFLEPKINKNELLTNEIVDYINFVAKDEINELYPELKIKSGIK